MPSMWLSEQSWARAAGGQLGCTWWPWTKDPTPQPGMVREHPIPYSVNPWSIQSVRKNLPRAL